MNDVINLIGLTTNKGKLFEKPFSNSLILTFNIDFLFYEKTLLKEFLNLGSSNNILFVDQNQLLTSQNTQYKFISGDASAYVFQGIKIGNLFHSKAILLTSNDESRLIIGSGNLTFSGMSLNNELFKEFSTKVPNDLPIFSAFKEYIDLLNTQSSTEPFIKSRIEKAFAVQSLQDIQAGEKSKQFLHNLNEPILAQIHNEIKTARKVYILSPFYDKNFQTLSYIKENIQADIKLFIQPTYTNFSVEDYDRDFPVFTFQSNSRNTHAKLIIFEHENSLSILFGSPNCTSPALLEKAEKGNAEIGIFLQEVDKSLLSYYRLTDQQPINYNEIIPIPQNSLHNLSKFILKNATYTKDDVINLSFIKPISNEDTIVLKIDNHLVQDVTLTKNEKLDKITFAYILEPNKPHYITSIINNHTSNTIVIQNEQKDLFDINTPESKAMNNLKQYFTFNSVEDIIFARSFDPFIQIKSVSTREYSVEDDNLGEDEKKEQENIKESKDYYISYQEVAAITQMKEFSGTQRKSFIYDLLTTVPHHFTTSSQGTQNSESNNEANERVIINDTLPEYKRYIHKLLQRLNVLARIYQTTKKDSLRLTDFYNFFRDTVEIIPLINLLMSGVTYKIPVTDKTNSYEIITAYLTPQQVKAIAIPTLEVSIGFWKNALDHVEFINYEIPKKYLVRLLSLSIGNLILFEYIFRSNREDKDLQLNQDKFYFLFYSLSSKLLQSINTFSIETEMLIYEYINIKSGILGEIMDRYDWSNQIEEDYASFLALSKSGNEFWSNKQMILEYLSKSKKNPEKSLVDQLRDTINK